MRVRDSGGDLDGSGNRAGSPGIQNGAGCVVERAGSASRRLSPSAYRVCRWAVSPVTVRCRPRPEQTGHDVGRRPALSGLSIHPLIAHRHPVACRAAARLAACSYCSDSLCFGVHLDLLCCCCRRFIGRFGELFADLELLGDARDVPAGDWHRGLTWVGVDLRKRGAAPCWQLCQWRVHVYNLNLLSLETVSPAPGPLRLVLGCLKTSYVCVVSANGPWWYPDYDQLRC